MSKNWFPMIDFQHCNGCLACLETCENDVFEARGKLITVALKENCIEGCRQCKTYCMTKAIVFPDEIENMVEQGYMKCDCGDHLLKSK